MWFHRMHSRPMCRAQIEEQRKREIAELILIKTAQAKRKDKRASRTDAEPRLSRSLSPTAAAAASKRSPHSQQGAMLQPPSQLAGPEAAVAWSAAVSAVAAGASPIPLEAPKSMLASVSQSVKSAEEQEFDQLIEDSINRKEQEEEEKRREARKEAKEARRAARRAAAAQPQASAAAQAAASAREQEQAIRQERKTRLFGFGRRSKSESSARAKRDRAPGGGGLSEAEQKPVNIEYLLIGCVTHVFGRSRAGDFGNSRVRTLAECNCGVARPGSRCHEPPCQHPTTASRR